MARTESRALLLAGLLALSGCATTGTPTTAPAPTPSAARVLGLYELNVNGLNGPSAQATVRPASGLSAQATEYAKGLGSRYEQELLRLRYALIGTSALTGLLSALLILRALLMWRGEHLRTRQREERQIEALNLASHEMRRPLQTLLLASDLLRRAETPDQQQRLLSMIEDSASQISNRADLGRLKDLYLDVTLNPQRTDLRPLLRRFSAERVHVVTPDAPVPWPVDAGRFRQMIENLVENALKYTDGVVEVSLATPGGRPQVQVRDFGPGMSAELQGRVFEPYERGPVSLGSGQGLGLPLVRRYARAHGGDVTISHAPGGGLIMTVTLGDPATHLRAPVSATPAPARRN